MRNCIALVVATGMVLAAVPALAQTNEGGQPRSSATQNSTNENATNKGTKTGGATASSTGKAAPTQNATNENASAKGVGNKTTGKRSKSSSGKRVTPTQTDD